MMKPSISAKSVLMARTVAAAFLAPSLALASGNTLTWTSPVYDTTYPKFGSAALPS